MKLNLMLFIQEIIYLIKNGTYIINLDEYKATGIHQIALFINDNNVNYFDSFRVERIRKEIKSITGNENIVTNIYKI